MAKQALSSNLIKDMLSKPKEKKYDDNMCEIHVIGSQELILKLYADLIRLRKLVKRKNERIKYLEDKEETQMAMHNLRRNGSSNSNR